MVDGAAQVTHQREPPRAFFVEQSAVQRDAARHVSRATHRDIGAPHELVGVAPMTRVERDTNGGSGIKQQTRKIDGFVERRDDALCHRCRAIGARWRQQQRKLVLADARKHLLLAPPIGGNASDDLHEEAIARPMS